MSSTSPAPTRTRPATIRRFTGVQRLLHLILTITFLGMLWTGLCLWSPALAEVMNRPLAKQWHFYSAIALGVAFVLILVLRPRDVRAFASAVDQLDRAALGRQRYVHRRHPRPRHSGDARTAV